jgi:large subunit ribosomal protein L3
MLSALLGRKVGMTQIFSPTGSAFPVTVIEAGPCVVTQVKTAARDGYEAVQLGFGKAKVKNTPRPELGHLGHQLEPTPAQRRRQQQAAAKARQEARKKSTEQQATETEAEVAQASEGTAKQQPKRGAAAKHSGPVLGPFAVLREVRSVGQLPALGDSFFADMFAIGERVDVIGTSKGKGFAGVVKRHGFRGGPRTHGQSDRLRAPGSIGSGTTPGRVIKGMRMAGRMGGERVTVKALEVIQADRERNLLVIKGSIPGANGSIVMVRKGRPTLMQAAQAVRAERAANAGA